MGNESGGAEGSGDGVGAGGSNWHDGLPADIVAAPYFRNATSLEQAISDLTTAADNAGNSIRIPGPDADDAARAEFYGRIVEKAPGVMRTPDMDNPSAISAILAQLGKPAEAKDYAITAVEGAELTPERTGELKAMALEAGLTRTQFDGFMKQMLTGDAKALGVAKVAHEQQVGELKGEWGAAYTERMAKVAKMLEITGSDPGLVKAAADGTLPPAQVRWLYKLADRLGGGEGGAVGDQGKGEPPEGRMTPAEATLRLEELNKKLIGNFDLTTDERLALTAKRMELIQLKSGETADANVIRRAIYGK